MKVIIGGRALPLRKAFEETGGVIRMLGCYEHGKPQRANFDDQKELLYALWLSEESGSHAETLEGETINLG